jgi:glycosyltransferase involved in cell wall biosynthesis
MRLLHVFTLASPDGAFGGPLRVAFNQAAGLSARGHEVVVAAGHQGYGRNPPEELEGAPVRLFPARRVLPSAGVSGLAAPSMLTWARGAFRRADVVHVHLGRDLVTLPAALLALRLEVPYVVQTHGMVIGSGHPLAGPMDTLMTRRVLHGAARVFYLNQPERDGLQQVTSESLALAQLSNGVPAAGASPLPERREILFCSRLHKRKRPLMFVDMARRLLAEGFDADFVLVGPDGGEGAAVAAAIEAAGHPQRLRWEGALDPGDTLARISRATMLVLPSTNEPWAMAVIEALSVGRPVVVTDTCGVADAVRQYRCGMVVDETFEGLVDAVRTALSQPDLLTSMAAQAVVAARERFSMDAVLDRLEGIYTEVASSTRRW